MRGEEVGRGHQEDGPPRFLKVKVAGHIVLPLTAVTAVVIALVFEDHPMFLPDEVPCRQPESAAMNVAIEPRLRQPFPRQAQPHPGLHG